MPEVHHTLIIGDSIANALYDALFTIPGTGAIWRDVWETSPISPEFWAKDVDLAMRDIANGVDGKVPDKLPDTVLVSLGRQEILGEPQGASVASLKPVSDDTARLVDALRAQKLKVLWILPPAIKGEGVTRDVIAQALAAKGVRVFPAQHSFDDPSARGEAPKDLPKDTAQRMADLIATWAPLRPIDVPIMQRHPDTAEEQPSGGGLVTGFSNRLSGMSTGGKVALVGGAALLLGGAVYFGYKRSG